MTSDAAEIDAAVRDAFPWASEETPGYALRVLTPSGVLLERCAGLASLEHRIPITPASVFPLSSVTKPLTATAALMAAARGALDLDAPVRGLVDDLPRAFDAVRLRHLLAQTSGIPDPYEAFDAQGANPYGLTNADVLRLLRGQAPDFAPGTRFAYSNANYVLLAVILERVEGQPYGAVMRRRIFEPLGMDRSLVYDDRYVIPNRAYGYAGRKARPGAGRTPRPGAGRAPRSGAGWRTQPIAWLTYGDGGVHSTLDDVTRWARSLLGQGPALLPPALQREAWAPSPANTAEPVGYGCGWAVREMPHGRMVYHTGGDPGFGSLVSLIPDAGLAVVILSNADGSWRAMRPLAARLCALFAE